MVTSILLHNILLCSRDGLPVSSQVCIPSPPWSCVQCQLFPIPPQPLPHLWHRHNHPPLLSTGCEQLLLIFRLSYYSFSYIIIDTWMFSGCQNLEGVFLEIAHTILHGHPELLILWHAINRLVLSFFLNPPPSSPLLFSWWSQGVVTYFLFAGPRHDLLCLLLVQEMVMCSSMTSRCVQVSLASHVSKPQVICDEKWGTCIYTVCMCVPHL